MNWKFWEKKEKASKQKAEPLQQQEKQKKQKQVNIGPAQDPDKMMELLKSSLLIGKTDEKFQTIIDNIAWLRSNVAQQNTLEKIGAECAKESTLQEIDKRLFYIIANKLSNEEAKALGGEGTEHLVDKPKEAGRIAVKVQEEVEKTIIRNSQNKILEALKQHKELPFGNDAKTKGITKYTRLNRSWVYKAVYLGWDSTGNPKEPQKDTLAGKGLVEVDTSKKPFRVKVKE